MKYLFSILLVTIQFKVLGQPSDWDKAVLRKNKVKDVSVYARVPKTNPEHPLMLWRQFSFDSAGRVTRKNCRRCDVSMHNGTFDVIETFQYEKDHLVRIERQGRDKESIDFLYNNLGGKRVGVTKNEQGERIEVTLEYLDSLGRETLEYAITFANSYNAKDSVYQVHLSKREIKYGTETVTTETYGSHDFVDFGQAVHVLTFDYFKASNNVEEIEKVLLSMDLKLSNTGHRIITKRYKEKIEVKNSKTGETVNVYYLDDKGLIKEEERLVGKRIQEFEYHYSVLN